MSKICAGSVNGAICSSWTLRCARQRVQYCKGSQCGCTVFVPIASHLICPEDGVSEIVFEAVTSSADAGAASDAPAGLSVVGCAHSRDASKATTDAIKIIAR
jgi:hypothetical protein